MPRRETRDPGAGDNADARAQRRGAHGCQHCGCYSTGDFNCDLFVIFWHRQARHPGRTPPCHSSDAMASRPPTTAAPHGRKVLVEAVPGRAGKRQQVTRITASLRARSALLGHAARPFRDPQVAQRRLTARSYGRSRGRALNPRSRGTRHDRDDGSSSGAGGIYARTPSTALRARRRSRPRPIDATPWITWTPSRRSIPAS